MRGALAGAVVAAAAALSACGGSSAVASGSVRPAGGGGDPLALAHILVVPHQSYGPGFAELFAGDSSGPLDVSFDLRLAPHSSLSISLGRAKHVNNSSLTLRRPPQIVFSRGSGRSLSVTVPGRAPVELRSQSGWIDSGGSRHVELGGGVLAVDGKRFDRVGEVADAVVFGTQGHAVVDGLITTPAAERAALAFHRLAELHARVRKGEFPTGATVDDRLYFDPGWTSGFYAGALWQAAALEPAGGMFARWALAATVDHFGMERSPTHDVGFMYGQSSLNAYEALCGHGGSGSASLCARLRGSVVSAADELVALAGSNPGSGTIPTDPTSPEAETIIDSMMNIPILPWASSVTGNGSYERLALHQARVIASVLLRRDGSTGQSANFDRASGRLVSVTTHQGLSDRSTWARGEGWALYGFSVAALEQHSRAFLRVAQRVAGYVAVHLPASGVPRWDYDAPAGAPVDVSAGVITAAGFLHLVAACDRLGGAGCGAAARAGWVALARRMLAAAVTGYASARPPLGLLRSQIQDQRWGGGCWCNHGELIYGLSYALEALRWLR